MANRVDDRYNALVQQGYTGSLHEMLYAWLGDAGGTGESLRDRWYSALIAQGATPSTVQDMWYQVLGNLGYTQGSLVDRECAFWLDGGVFTVDTPLIYTITANTDLLWGDIQDAGGTIFDFPTTATMNFGLNAHSPISNTGPNGSQDRLTFIRVQGVADITKAVNKAVISLNISSWQGTAAPTLKVRAIKDSTLVTFAATGGASADALGYPDWTTASVNWTPVHNELGRYDIDVTTIINELVTLGKATGNIIFVLESIDPFDEVVRQFRFGGMTNYLNQIALIIHKSSPRANQTRKVANGSVIHFHPFDEGDLVDVTNVRTLVSTSAGGRPQPLVTPQNRTLLRLAARPRRYGVLTTQGCTELDDLDKPARSLVAGIFQAIMDDYGWQIAAFNKSYLMFRQSSRQVGVTDSFLFDSYGDFPGGMVFEPSELTGLRFGASGNVLVPNVACPVVARDVDLEVHSLALFYDAPNDTVYFGMNNGSGETLSWTAGDVVAATLPALQSGYAWRTNTIPQGQLFIELTTTPTLQTIKDACDDMRKRWRFGVKMVSPLLLA